MSPKCPPMSEPIMRSAHYSASASLPTWTALASSFLVQHPMRYRAHCTHLKALLCLHGRLSNAAS
ncbi:hypothetical protein IQ06DRAFT_124733 [Phaeosphaeriaceae sp. SRC1lsM3a]|nr:hypothetical protein IQ06DRAFT_124733 [Stagonospora sp. SRC1lsM3a]